MKLWSIAIIPLVASNVGPAFAAVYSTPLSLETNLGAHGEYRVASFDFDIEFAAIESVSVEFVMPAGYMGTVVTTGNSSYSRNMNVGLHDESSSIDFPSLDDSPTLLTNSTIYVPAGVPHELHFSPLQFFHPSLMLPQPDWPEFIYEGRGKVAFVDSSISSFHPLPDGMPTDISISWTDPGPIESVRLTIVGTPVPEPPTVVLALFAGVLFVAGMGWRRHLPTVAALAALAQNGNSF